MNLIPTREALDVVEFGILALLQTTDGIKKSLKKDNSEDKTRENKKKNLKFKVFNAAKKRESEKLIEAKQPAKFIGGGIRGAINSTGSFFGGLLRAAGWLLLSFIVEKLPEIIATAEKVIKVVQEIYDGAKTTIENIGSTLKEFSEVAVALKDYILSFGLDEQKEKNLKKEFDDFTNQLDTTRTDYDLSFDKIKESIEDLRNVGIDDVNKARKLIGREPVEEKPSGETKSERPEKEDLASVTDRIKVLREKLKSGEITKEDYKKQMQELAALLAELNKPLPQETRPAPQRPSQTTPPAEQQQPRTTSPSEPPSSSSSGVAAVYGTAEERALLDAIAFAEGTYRSDGYSTWAGYQRHGPADLTNLTIQQVHDLQTSFITSGKVNKTGSAVVGRYQFLELRDHYAKQAGLKPSDKFSPENQDKMALVEARRVGINSSVLRKEGLSRRISDILAPIWASFPYSPKGGASYYGGQPSKPLNQIQKIYNSRVGKKVSFAAPPRVMPAINTTVEEEITIPFPINMPMNREVASSNYKREETPYNGSSSSDFNIVPRLQRFNRNFT